MKSVLRLVLRVIERRLPVVAFAVFLFAFGLVPIAAAQGEPMPPGFFTWQQFLSAIATPAALLAIVQLLKVIEAFVRVRTGHPLPPGEGITDKYAILLTGIVAGLVQIFSQVAQGWQAPDPMLWIAAQAFFMWAVAQFYYVVGKAGQGKMGGLGK